MSTKETNPKDAVAVKKVPWHLLPWRALAGAALGLLEGACKYGAFNYRVAGIRVSVYVSATMRHLLAYWEGREIDPDSGLHEIDKAIASLIVLRDGLLQGNYVDDRPPAAAAGWLEVANLQALDIIEKYPDPKPAFTQKSGQPPITMAERPHIFRGTKSGLMHSLECWCIESTPHEEKDDKSY